MNPARPNFRMHIVPSPERIGYSVYFVDSNFSGDKSYYAELTMVERPINTAIEPTIRLHHDDAQVFMQHLMDNLWSNGIRPKDIGTAGHLAATQVHLEDMRAIVFEKLKVTKWDVRR